MTNDHLYYFKDLGPLIGTKPAYILVSSNLQMQNLGGVNVITVTVEMTGYSDANEVMFKVRGCPYPPCKPAHLIPLR